jgi:DNA-binding transcriptional MerR regulator
MAPEHAELSISAVAARTGIPVSTLRFYERELPGLFHIRKTSGGHRRYGEGDVERFAAVRRLTEAEGLGLGEVRRVLMSRGDAEALREEVERVRDAGAADGQALRDLAHRVDALEGRIATLEAAPPRRRWLRPRQG